MSAERLDTIDRIVSLKKGLIRERGLIGSRCTCISWCSARRRHRKVRVFAVVSNPAIETNRSWEGSSWLNRIEKEGRQTTYIDSDRLDCSRLSGIKMIFHSISNLSLIHFNSLEILEEIRWSLNWLTKWKLFDEVQTWSSSLRLAVLATKRVKLARGLGGLNWNLHRSNEIKNGVKEGKRPEWERMRMERMIHHTSNSRKREECGGRTEEVDNSFPFFLSLFITIEWALSNDWGSMWLEETEDQSWTI